MLKIGITGGIGSGKTLMATIFQHLGIKVYDADSNAKQLMVSHSGLVEQLIEEFGNEVFINNSLNKKYLASLIFNNAEKLKKINSIVHPFVFEDFIKWAQMNQNQPYILFESAILFETGYYKKMDRNITVITDRAMQVLRIMERDNISKAEVEERMSNQVDDEKRLEISDFVITNTGNELVLPQVLAIHENILKL